MVLSLLSPSLPSPSLSPFSLPLSLLPPSLPSPPLSPFSLSLSLPSPSLSPFSLPLPAVITVYVRKEEEKVYNALLLDSLTVHDFKLQVHTVHTYSMECGVCKQCCGK